MLITLVLFLSTGSLLCVESHQSLNLTSSPSSSSPNRQYHQSNSSPNYSSFSSTTGLGHGHPTAIARRNLQQQQPSHYKNKHSGPSSSPSSPNGNPNQSGSLVRRYWPGSSQSPSQQPPPSSYSHEHRPLYRGPRARPGFLDVLETSPHEIRVHPGGTLRSHSQPPPPPPHRHNRKLGSRPSKPEIAITELKDMTQIHSKILRAVKDRIQSMPGLKAFLLTKDGHSGPKIKPSILLTAPAEYSNKPGQLIWRLLNSKSSKMPNGFAKSLSSLGSRSRFPPPSASPVFSSPPPQQSSPSALSTSTSSSPNLSDKYTFIEVPSSIDLDGTSTSFSDSPFPSENIIINPSENTESSPEEILIESSDNQMASNGLTSNNGIDAGSNSNGNNNNNIGNFNTLNGPIQTAESIAEAIEELPRTYYYRDTTEPKGYHGTSDYHPRHHHHHGDYLQATSSIRDNSFASSPFTVNEHVPLSPLHNGWIPKNSKHWNPGAYRSAFYTPDTRLIKFTIHDRVSSTMGKQLMASSSSVNTGSYIHPSLIVNNKNNGKPFEVNQNNNNINSNSDSLNSNNNNVDNRNSVNSNNNVNSNVNSYQSNSRNSLSNKYGNDYPNQPSYIEESYNINEDDLMRTTITPTTIITTISSTTTSSPLTSSSPITVNTSTFSPVSSEPSTSSHNKATSETSPSPTTIKPPS